MTCYLWTLFIRNSNRSYHVGSERMMAPLFVAHRKNSAEHSILQRKFRRVESSRERNLQSWVFWRKKSAEASARQINNLHAIKSSYQFKITPRKCGFQSNVPCWPCWQKRKMLRVARRGSGMTWGQPRVSRAGFLITTKPGLFVPTRFERIESSLIEFTFLTIRFILVVSFRGVRRIFAWF
jgi:hypothetical protein